MKTVATEAGEKAMEIMKGSGTPAEKAAEISKVLTAPDIFLWANQADAHKTDFEIDLFLFTKGYTVYSTTYSKELKAQMKVLFLYDMISQVQTGAATGMRVRDMHVDTEDVDVLDFTELDRVEHAQEVIEQIAYGEESLELWHGADHDSKKLKGIVARFTREGSEPFYITKLIAPSHMLKGTQAWALDGEKFMPMQADTAVRITPDNQVLISGSRVFAFNISKFTRQFGYEPQKTAQLDAKIAQIESHFKLKFPEGLTLGSLLNDNPSLATKILKVDPDTATGEQVIEHADEYNLGLLYDESTGEIIIMNKRDLGLFIDLLNDDYVGSDMTGIHYVATKKKEVRDTEVSQLNTGL